MSIPYLDVLPEATRVVVADGPCVAESLEDGVGLQDLLLDRSQLRGASLAAEDGQVLHDDLACFGLTRAGFTTHQDRLIFPDYGKLKAERQEKMGG